MTPWVSMGPAHSAGLVCFFEVGPGSSMLASQELLGIPDPRNPQHTPNTFPIHPKESIFFVATSSRGVVATPWLLDEMGDQPLPNSNFLIQFSTLGPGPGHSST